MFDGKTDCCEVAILAPRIWLPLSSTAPKRKGPSVLGSVICQQRGNDSCHTLENGIRQETGMCATFFFFSA